MRILALTTETDSIRVPVTMTVHAVTKYPPALLPVVAVQDFANAANRHVHDCVRAHVPEGLPINMFVSAELIC